MKACQLCIFITFICTLSVQAQTLPLPIIHYDFDNVTGNSIKDWGLQKINGTSFVNPLYVTGVSGKGIEFDGKDDYVNVPLRVPNKGSISLWYFPHRLYNYNTIFDNSVHENDWEMWIQGEPINQPWFTCPYCLRFRLGGNDKARDVGRAS